MKINGFLGIVATALVAHMAAAKEDIEHTQFTPVVCSDDRAALWEQFTGAEEDIFKLWKPSSHKEEDKGEEYSYVGRWAIEEPTVLKGFTGDKGLVVKSPAARHAISRKLDRVVDNTGNTLVVQYEVKLQKGLECGGAYIKLLSENEALHAEEFSGDTPYQVMFGPDRCGSTNKVHFIIRRKNPISGEYEEKHLASTPVARFNKVSNLYTLIINPDQTYEVRINGEVVRAGLMTDEGVFKPSFNPPKEVDDVNDVKPEDWIDEEMMLDPDQAEKPEDWDEDAPFQIPDPEATKPADWDEDEPLYIPDPEAEKPDGWDDEEDGEWIAPEVPNPRCEELEGCGPWEAPKIRNPDFKGKWKQPMIVNPDYKGPWKPRQVANPDYFEDSAPSNLEPIGAVGFELWTMQNDILFDNIYIGHSVEAAEQVGNETFIPKQAIELAEEKANAPEPLKKDKQYESAMDYFRDDPVGYVKTVARMFILNFSVDPQATIKNQPVVALVASSALFISGMIAFIILRAVLSVIFGGKKVPAKKKETVADEQSTTATSTDSAKASGVETKTATKRT